MQTRFICEFCLMDYTTAQGAEQCEAAHPVGHLTGPETKARIVKVWFATNDPTIPLAMLVQWSADPAPVGWGMFLRQGYDAKYSPESQLPSGRCIFNEVVQKAGKE